MVVYSGQILTEMINGIKCLGLERQVMEEDDKMDQKRKKLAIMETNLAKDIFDYATCLRKTKARIKRNGKRKRKKDKENLVEEVTDYDEDMGDAADLKALGSEFIFRAKRLRVHMCNNRPGAIVRERLDLAFGNVEFRNEFDHALVFNVEPVGSDHHALIVDCWFCDDKFPKHIKFEAAWAQHEDFLKIVGEGWNDVEGHLNNRLNDLIRRLATCQKWLVKWSRFIETDKQLNLSASRLKTTCWFGMTTKFSVIAKSYIIVRAGQMSSAGLKEAEDLVKQLKEAWVREESYWWQRS
ncbi:hypothetical protein K1719_024154 [Acacia pycnantha]|nr:hypothetical protein K1719_024154 [Acacia pycnantha]